VLNQCDEEALFQGRFFYQTVALPPMLTHGKAEVALKIAVLGPMWPYGSTFAQKQRNFTQPSRGIYRAYTHTLTRFSPEASEKQGDAIAPQARPAGLGEEILQQMKGTVNSRLNRLMEAASTGGNASASEGTILLLAEAYNTPWTVAYHNPRAVAALVHAGDAFLRQGVIGPSWTGTGPLGEAVMRVGPEPLQKALEDEIEVSARFPFVPDWRRREPLEEPAIKEAPDSGEKVRMLDVTPTVMRVATVISQFEVDSCGEEWTRPDIIDFERSGGFPPPRPDDPSGMARREAADSQAAG
jgi:hypothetical protein